MAELRAKRIYSDSALTLVAVESIETRHVRTDSSFHVIGRAEPIAVVVSGPDGQYALDMEARPTDLGRLMRDVGGLGAISRR